MASSRVCMGCGCEKPLTTDYFYRYGDGSARFKAKCILCLRAQAAERRAAETPEQRKRRLARNARNARHIRKSRRGREQNAERCRRWREAVYADEQRTEQQREAARMRYRLRAEREGREVAASRAKAPAPNDRIPTLPLAQAIERLIESERKRLDPYTLPGIGDAMRAAVCGRLGIHERALYAWRTGSRTDVELGTVDEVLVRAGWLWFDVFDESTVRRAALEVTRYVHRPRLMRGALRICRERVATVRYGDLGPDRAALAAVEYAFTGEGLDVEEQLTLDEPDPEPQQWRRPLAAEVPDVIGEYRERRKARRAA